MANAFGAAEREAICPVPLDDLGRLYRSDPDALLRSIGQMGEEARNRLAAWCYSRAHLREIGLSAAALCSEEKLTLMAGSVGTAMAVQSRAKVRRFGADPIDPIPAKPKISLAGSVR